MTDRLLDIKNEEFLEARFEKQTLCLSHGKRCNPCNGEDELGNKCKYKKGGDINGPDIKAV